MECDNSDFFQCDDCDMQEKCCLECDKGSTCKNICRVQTCRNHWNSETTEELIQEISSDESTVLNLAVSDRLELLQKRISYLENLIAESFLNTEGEYSCPLGYGYDDVDCKDCEIIDLCDEAKKIVKKAEASINDNERAD